MVSTSNIVLVLAVILALSHVGTCLQCYQCGDDKEGCKDPFNEKDITKQTCGELQTECTKTVKDGKYSRGCEIGNLCSAKPDNQCVACSDDLCNSSSSIVPSFIVTSFAAIIFAKYFL